MTHSLLHDLFWTTEPVPYIRTELPKIKWKKAPKPPLGDINEAIAKYESEWDELEHYKEQYEIKCDEIRGVHREMERLTKIILKHGLDKELELP